MIQFLQIWSFFIRCVILCSFRFASIASIFGPSVVNTIRFLLAVHHLPQLGTSAIFRFAAIPYVQSLLQQKVLVKKWGNFEGYGKAEGIVGGSRIRILKMNLK